MSQTIEKITTAGFMKIAGEATIYPGEDRLQIIAGGNKQGKSSFISGISEILLPATGQDKIKTPINTNADGSTWSEIVTDQFIYRKDWPVNGPGKLSITDRQTGKKHITGGKEIIAEHQAGLIFKPSDFLDMSGAEQRELMLRYVSLPFDLLAIEKEKEKHEADRLIVGREEKQLAGQLAGFPAPIADLPTVETPSSAILSQLDQVRAHNAAVNQGRAEAQRAGAAAAAAHAEVTRLQALYQAAYDALTVANAAAQAATEAAATLEFKDETQLVAALAGADEFNASIRRQNERAVVEAAHKAKKAEYEAHSEAIKAIEKTKADGIAKAVFPVGGWKIDDNGITLNGVPFRQFSRAEKNVGAILLATLANPSLKLIIVEEGDFLDDVSLAEVRNIAETRDCYILMERDRDDSRGIASIVFIDGVGTAAVAE